MFVARMTKKTFRLSSATHRQLSKVESRRGPPFLRSSSPFHSCFRKEFQSFSSLSPTYSPGTKEWKDTIELHTVKQGLSAWGKKGGGELSPLFFSLTHGCFRLVPLLAPLLLEVISDPGLEAFSHMLLRRHIRQKCSGRTSRMRRIAECLSCYTDATRIPLKRIAPLLGGERKNIVGYRCFDAWFVISVCPTLRAEKTAGGNRSIHLRRFLSGFVPSLHHRTAWNPANGFSLHGNEFECFFIFIANKW